MTQDNHLYFPKTLQVNYMSYNLKCQQDVINPTSHPDIMVLSCEDREDKHPFWYAQVIKIFHVLVYHCGSASQIEHTPTEPQHMECTMGALV